MILKEILLSTHLFLENEYFEAYLKLIEDNKNTEKQKCKTQKHHIIPNIAFKLYNWDGADEESNFVNLLYKDHILAHYYLALATSETSFKYKMIAAINFILGKAIQVKLDVESLKTFVLELDKYQELYEEWCKSPERIAKSHIFNEDRLAKMSNSMKGKNVGKIYVNKDGVVRALFQNEVDLFLSNGWKLGNPNCIKRDLHQGSTIVNKNNIEKYILKEELQEYLNNGWEQGRTEAHKLASKNGTQAYYDTLTKEEKIKKCATRTGQHWQMSDEQKEKISIANKGKKQSIEQKLKNSIDKKGTIWMTDGEKDIMTKKELEQDYINQGFYRGRSKNRKENIKEGDFYEYI